MGGLELARVEDTHSGEIAGGLRKEEQTWEDQTRQQREREIGGNGRLSPQARQARWFAVRVMSVVRSADVAVFVV